MNLKFILVSTCVFAGLAHAADPAEQHFTLRLPDLTDLTDYELSGGGRVTLPIGRTIKSLQFILAGPAASRLGSGKVAVTVNGQSVVDVAVAMKGTTLLATITSTGDDGFVPANARVTVEAHGMRNNDFGQKWVLRQGKTSFLQETVGETDGAPIQINLQEPDRAILIHADEPNLEVDVKGSVDADLASLTLNGEPLAFKLKSGQATFSGKINVNQKTKRLELRAKDKSGSSSTVWVPVKAAR